jgi:O-antigen/teichoic acid export membrane protein
MFGLYAAVSAVAHIGVLLLATEKYLYAAAIVPWIAMGHLWSGTPRIFGMGVMIARRTAWHAVAVAAGVAVNLGALQWTVGQHGLLAAGTTYWLGSLTGALALLAISQRCHRLPFRYSVITVFAIGSIGLPLAFQMLPPTDYSSPAAGEIVLGTLLRMIVAATLWLTACAWTLWPRHQPQEEPIPLADSEVSIAMRRSVA